MNHFIRCTKHGLKEALAELEKINPVQNYTLHGTTRTKNEIERSC